MRVDEVQHNNNNFTFSCEVFWIFSMQPQLLISPVPRASQRPRQLWLKTPCCSQNPQFCKQNQTPCRWDLHVRSYFCNSCFPNNSRTSCTRSWFVVGHKLARYRVPCNSARPLMFNYFAIFTHFEVFLYSQKKKKKLSHKQPHTCCYALALMSCCDGRERGAFQELHIVLMLSIFHTLNNG